MIIACDVDAVVADLIQVWLDRYNADYNDRLTKRDILSWGVDSYVKPECGTKIYKYIEDPSIYNDVFPEPMAYTGVNFLRDLGHRVVFVTSTPAGVQGAKLNWLRRWGFLDKDYSALKDYVEASDKGLILADWLIDDYVENLKAFRGNGILFNQPWNVDLQWRYRVRGWKGLMENGFFHQV